VISASYVFDLSVTYSTIFVARPTQIGSTPDTSEDQTGETVSVKPVKEPLKEADIKAVLDELKGPQEHYK
jgi:hypothetical protein